MPRSDYDLHRRPSSANIVCELKTVHRPRHVDIREDKTDFLVHFEQSNGIVAAPRLLHLEASVLDQDDGPHSDQRLVLYDQNRGAWPPRFTHEGKLRSRAKVQVIRSCALGGLRHTEEPILLAPVAAGLGWCKVMRPKSCFAFQRVSPTATSTAAICGDRLSSTRAGGNAQILAIVRPRAERVNSTTKRTCAASTWTSRIDGAVAPLKRGRVSAIAPQAQPRAPPEPTIR